ncbi:recombination mediator RecR [Oscillatoria amoena NRMC-F 0135]|nr:recombination mediator RecR [Oscillatoria laete-virens]MDL5048695.1 recombination mediator RecR [Oscillatoria amoena NRMC-F 0135]MDL5053212.1 recombination mediator RecR [Oscillatoria laete-virens NRMC-F 0139]
MAHDYPEALKNAIDAFGKLPGIGKRGAERIVLSLLEKNNPLPVRLIHTIQHLTSSVKHCSICGNHTESDPCAICADPSRDRSVICVVENPQDILSIEKSGGFRGLYHALMGRLSPLDGVNPEDLRIQELLDRAHESVEVILALGTELESETTAIYIAKLLKNKNVKVSRIAYGISAGVGLEYADSVTLARALEGRRAV